MEDMLGGLLAMLGMFGGISLLVWTSTKAKIERLKAERQDWQPTAMPNESAVLAELKALKQQMGEMQSTGHQFDLSFDAALNRLEGRVDRLETKSAATAAVPAPGTEAPQSLRNGHTP